MSQDEAVPIELRAAREALTTWDGFIAFGFGSGLLARAPGTWGTLVALFLSPALLALPAGWLWMVLALLFALGVVVCDRVGKRLGVDDYGGLVIDEMVSFWLVAALAPPGWTWLLAAFVLFRFFDILKPWPIGLVDRHFHGGLGVMLDDVGAAFYAWIMVLGAERAVGF